MHNAAKTVIKIYYIEGTENETFLNPKKNASERKLKITMLMPLHKLLRLRVHTCHVRGNS